MTKHVLDAKAIMTFLEDQPGSAIISDLLWKSLDAHRPLLMSAVSWGAVCHEISRSYGEPIARSRMHELQKLPIELIVVDVPICIAAASLATELSIPLINTFAISLALQRKATLVTTRGDYKLPRELKVMFAH